LDHSQSIKNKRAKSYHNRRGKFTLKGVWSTQKEISKMKELSAKIIIILLDILAIFLAIVLGYKLRLMFGDLIKPFDHKLSHYLDFWPLYLFPVLIMAYEGVYTKRYDFWHESKEVIKSLILALVAIMAILALTKTIDTYSRAAIFLIFLFMGFFIPLFKNIGKKVLFKMGLWQRKASIIGNDPFIRNEIFSNPYLGYVAADKKESKTIFINSKEQDAKTLRQVIDDEIAKRHEVIFIPLMNEYNLTQSHIYELSNTRTNLVVFQNRLKSSYRIILQQVFNYLLAILLLPVLLPIIGVFAYLIKKESPGPIVFTHNRVGQDGQIIPTLKFRSMYQDAEQRLKKLLAENEEIKREWETNFKLKDDPRITKIGSFLRKTSLDELPQIFNVLKGEMNFVGPRPVIQEELDKYYKDDAEYYFMVKPGITGLWQVSGRSDTDYDFRVNTDKWYVTNWSIWLDIVILLKTIKVVLKREGAY
jgi:undecaprenyl-phosphate galactose phosphotransferase